MTTNVLPSSRVLSYIYKTLAASLLLGGIYVTGCLTFDVFTGPETSANGSDKGQVHALALPGGPWAATSSDVAAAAAHAYPVTAGPPRAPQSYIPLMARLRRGHAGVHPAGAHAPIRGSASSVTIPKPDVRTVPDLWSMAFRPTKATSEDFVTAAPLDAATPPPPLALMQSHPVPAPVERFVVDLSPFEPKKSQRVSFESIRHFVFFAFGACALIGFTLQAQRLLNSTFGLRDLDAELELEKAVGSLPSCRKSPLPLLASFVFKHK